MTAPWTPMRWPAAWTDPASLDLVKGSGIDTLLIDNSDQFEPLRAAAARAGLHTAHPDSPLYGATIVKGEWPGVKMSRGSADASAGPTGVPWVDSNGWVIQLAAARKPGAAIWVEAPPPKENPRLSAGSYLTAIADSAASGGRWIISLDDRLAAGLKEQKPDAIATWKTISGATHFFAAHKDWAEFEAEAVIGVVSDFAGPNEFFSQELLNLLSRAGMHFRVIMKKDAAGPAFAGLKALLYADGEPPSDALRKSVLGFVQGGGMLIAAPKWGEVPRAQPRADEHPRYTIRSFGKGRVAVANADPDDPYTMANDAAILVSHRYDLVRFWNGGATGSSYAIAPGRKRAVVHLLFYANRGPDSASVRIAGPFRAVKPYQAGGTPLQPVNVVPQKDAVEVHLPQVAQYVALELEA